MTPEAFVAAARTYLGVPWRHLGRSTTGVDCIGLVLLAAREAGLDLDDPAPYAREPQGARLLAGVLAHGRRVPEARRGDVLVFRMGIYAGHLGIATTHRAYGGPAVLHAYAPHRHVVEQPMDAELRRALVATVRVTGG
jgi:cell wall-associated NlpC family hydrolase